MPVSVAKRGNKFRVVEKGKIAKTDKGNARDGGGHATRAQAQAQASAINRSISLRKKR